MSRILEQWDEILQVFKTEYDISNVAFSTWIKPLEVYEVNGNVITIIVRDQLTLQHIEKKYKFTSRAIDSVPQAVFCFLESRNFEDAIRYAVSLGTDSDTVGAIVGGVAEAFYRRVPEHIKNEIHRRAFPDEYWDVIRRFGDRVGF